MPLESNKAADLARWMGWEQIKQTDFPNKDWLLVTVHDQQGKDWTFAWNPFEDRNNCALLLDRVAEKDLQDYFTVILAQKVLGDRYSKDNPVYGERVISLNSDWMWEIITAPPDVIAEAVWELVKEGAQGDG